MTIAPLKAAEAAGEGRQGRKRAPPKPPRPVAGRRPAAANFKTANAASSPIFGVSHFTHVLY